VISLNSPLLHFSSPGVITDAFNTIGAPKKRGFVQTNQIKLAYRKLFNANDRFNKFLFARYFPYSRVGWQANYDDFFFSSIQMNCYTLFHELKEYAHEQDFMERREFTRLLIDALLEALDQI
jgi:hypothetical protein